MKSLLLSIVVLMNLPSPSTTQSLEAGQVFSNLHSTVSALEDVRYHKAGERETLVAKIDRSANIISEKWRQSKDKNVPQDYLRSINFDSELLRRTLDDQTSNDDILPILRDVNADLAVKVAHARATNGAQETLAPQVDVTVKTNKNGQEVGGYLVRCNPRRYSDQTTPMYVFNNATNPSNPTLRPLPPGNYKMWIEMPNGHEVSSKPVTIGGHGEAAQQIVFDLQ